MCNCVRIICILATAFLFGCFGNTNDKEISKKETVSKKAIMEINGRTVYETDFFNFASYVLREMDEENINNSVIKNQLIKDFTEHMLLLDEATKRGITADKHKMEKILESVNTAEGVQSLKVYSGYYDTDSDTLVNLMRERLIIEALLTEVVSLRVVVTEQDIKKRYQEKEAKEKLEAKAHILHIFTLKEDTADKAMKELRKGFSFNEVAERYSEGPERTLGGDLGFISEGDFPEIFAEAFKLPEGKYSNIVKSDYGYHIFFVKKILKPKKTTYEDVKSKIYFDLYTQKQEEKTREFIHDLYKNANIKFLNDINLMDYAGRSRDSK